MSKASINDLPSTDKIIETNAFPDVNSLIWKAPLEMSPCFIMEAAERCLQRVYFSKEDLAESKIRIVAKGRFSQNETIPFRHGLKGRAVELYIKAPADHWAIVEIFLADFRKVWNSLTTAQKFDEE